MLAHIASHLGVKDIILCEVSRTKRWNSLLSTFKLRATPQMETVCVCLPHDCTREQLPLTGPLAGLCGWRFCWAYRKERNALGVRQSLCCATMGLRRVNRVSLLVHHR